MLDIFMLRKLSGNIIVKIYPNAVTWTGFLFTGLGFSSVWPSQWTEHDITGVGQCRWLAPEQGEHVQPGVKAIEHPDNLCQHLLFDFCSTLNLTSPVNIKTSSNEVYLTKDIPVRSSPL